MMRRDIQPKVIVFTLALSLLGFIANAHANEPDGGFVKGACKADAQKYCADVKPGNGAVRDCMKQHESELSTDCKNNMTMMKEKMEKRMDEIKTACKADIDQYCKDITPGEGREMGCLHAHNDKVSAGCKEAMKKHHHPMMHDKGDMKGMHGMETPDKK